MKCKTLHISSMLQFFWQYQIHYRTSILIACKLAVLIFLWMYFRSIIICVKIYTTSMYCILPVASKHLWTVSSGRCCESKPILLWCESQLPTVVSSRSAAIQLCANSHRHPGWHIQSQRSNSLGANYQAQSQRSHSVLNQQSCSDAAIQLATNSGLCCGSFYLLQFGAFMARSSIGGTQ